MRNCSSSPMPPVMTFRNRYELLQVTRNYLRGAMRATRKLRIHRIHRRGRAAHEYADLRPAHVFKSRSRRKTAPYSLMLRNAVQFALLNLDRSIKEVRSTNATITEATCPKWLPMRLEMVQPFKNVMSNSLKYT